MVNASLRWLNNVSGVYILHSPGFLASYWSAGFEIFLQESALASHWLEDSATANFFTPTPEENDQYSLLVSDKQ